MTRPFGLHKLEHNNEERPWEHTPDVYGLVEDISDTLIIREQSQFLLTDLSGNVVADKRRGLGLYYRDARHLSRYELTLDEAYPLVLQSTANSGFAQEQVLGNHRMVHEGQPVGRCTIELRRERVLSQYLEERLTITNFNRFPVTIRPTYHIEADFADIFEVRGHLRNRMGHHSPPEVGERAITHAYLGADGVWRRTLVTFAREPDVISDQGATFVLHLQPRETIEICLSVVVDGQETGGNDDSPRHMRTEYVRWHEGFAGIHTNNEVFNEVLDRSLKDLRMLWTKDRAGQSFLAAGTPWFGTLFGRDSLISSLQTLPFQPEISRQCLALLARHQGQFPDEFRCEQPGKILHEVREGELCAVGELPYQRYYGSVDATPLFLLLAAEYFHWTADLEFLSGILPAIEAGLRWLRDYGDPDGNGFTEYRTDAHDGLRNQGWKDSEEAIMHSDGSLCDGPIALAEVQGYVYAAYRRLGPLLKALGKPRQAELLRDQAARLRQRFNRKFWLSNHAPPMALDGQKQPAEVMSSNAGQLLWSGILSRRRANDTRAALFENDMFSGWGIRTLSANASAYNPLGYHVGTIWPHDNGIIAQGLKRYGYEDEVNEIATALFDAARQFPSYRLPELFGGQPRTEFGQPVPYPVACRPQAWTAGSWLHLLQAILGIVPDAANHRLFLVRPELPFWLSDVHLQGIKVGQGCVNLHFYKSRGRTRVLATGADGIEVKRLSSWPRSDPKSGGNLDS